MNQRPTRILKLARHDEEAQREFEIDFLLSLTTQERFEMVLRHSREMLEMLIRNGHRKPFEVIKRQ
jgi:hypothetical protein